MKTVFKLLIIAAVAAALLFLLPSSYLYSGVM